MSKDKPQTKLERTLRRLAHALPAAIPYVGDVYSDYMSAKEAESLVEMLRAAKVETDQQLARVLQQLGIQNAALSSMLVSLIAIAERSPRGVVHKAFEKSNILPRVGQRANKIFNVVGEVNVYEGVKEAGDDRRR